MSTRSTTHFVSGDSKPVAIIYRHSDGYPEGHGVDLQRFFDDVEAQAPDTRFGDPSYLAAKLVVWLADMFAPYSQDYSLGDEERQRLAKENPLAFLSVGVVAEDPGDIEYRYVIDCGYPLARRRPTVTGYEVHGGYNGVPVTHVPVAIPAAA